jgi:Protein of unknown function (DUF2510)
LADPQVTEPATSPPAGWYADAENPGGLRYWDGQQWTDQRTPSAPPPGWYPDPQNPHSDTEQERYWDGEQWTEQRRPASGLDAAIGALSEADRQDLPIGSLSKIHAEEGERFVTLGAATSGPRGLIALTDRRVIFMWKVAGVKTNPFPLEHVTTAEAEGDRFELVANGTRLKFEDVAPEGKAAEVAGYIRDHGPNIGKPDDPDRSALNVLSERVRKAVLQQIGPEETVHVCLASAGRGLVALDSRLLIAKAGLLAGATFGAKVTSFDYLQIIGIEITTKVTTAVLQVQTANYPSGQHGGYWSSDKNTDPWKLPNTLPIANKKQAASWAPYLTEVRSLIDAAKREPTSAAGQSPPDIPESLERLHSLHQDDSLLD